MKKIALSILMLALAFPALADAKKTPNANAPDPSAMPVLEKLKATGDGLSYDYLGRRFGTDAWLITGKGVMQIVYTVPGGVSAVVGGVLVGPDGQEVSSAMQREFTEQNPERAKEMLLAAQQSVDKPAPAPAKPKSESVWARLGGLGFVTYAAADIDTPVPVVYALLDPDEADSKQMFARLLPLAERGAIALNVVPLLTRRADRLLDVAYVLASADAPEEWKTLIADAALDMPQTIDPKGAEALNANVSFAQDMKIYSVPFLFYRVPDAQGWGRVRALKGLPKDWDGFIGDLTAK